ncbi:2Fe-2S iron-sulfur cluster-binding protein [Hugenholtzia roseola]|uniref:2Fe-2S iron-sulfur cluster-binding protein n=1 Tax=Hugenholtzia roseola TaxID=1002 RepID=UPI00041032F8|nr:2Fe-2S iron-sulfur cluster-binding protein [Hugenholtzia roseola]
MPITIENLGEEIDFSKQDLLQEKSILTLILQNYIDFLHICGGKGKCTTCKTKILEGMELLTPLSPAEERLKRLNRLQADERLICQCQWSLEKIDLSSQAVLRLAVLPENQLPHLQYVPLESDLGKDS